MTNPSIRFLAVVAMALLLANTLPVLAADGTGVDMTGTWDLKVESPSGSGSPTFVLQQKDEVLSGTYSGAFGESAVQGTVSGASFELSFETAGVTITYKGKVAGDTIEGDVQFATFGSGTFTGNRK